MPPGDWAAGERGIGALPGREEEFRAGIETALQYAKATKCRILHAMAGVLPAGQDRAEAERTYLANLRHAADRLAAEDLTLVIEPINTRDIPGYFLNTTTQAMSIIERVGRANLKLQLDLYHVQIMEGDLAHRIRALAGHYPHVQIAGNPGRHEPDVGEINYPFPVRPSRRARLFGLDRLRVPAKGGDQGRARLGQALRHFDLKRTAPHPSPLPASGEREGPAKREGEGRPGRDSGGGIVRIVVTGGSGFLGRRVALRLLERGDLDELVLFDNAHPALPLPEDQQAEDRDRRHRRPR